MDIVIQCCGKTCEEFSICSTGQNILDNMAEKERPLCPFQGSQKFFNLLENAKHNAIQLEKIIDSMKAKLPWYKRPTKGE